MSGLIFIPRFAKTSAVPQAVGQQNFTTAGTFNWVAPPDCRSVCVLLIGSGGKGVIGGSRYNYYAQGGTGGNVTYRNHVPVIPGQTYTIIVANRSNSTNPLNSSFSAAGGSSVTYLGRAGSRSTYTSGSAGSFGSTPGESATSTSHGKSTGNNRGVDIYGKRKTSGSPVYGYAGSSYGNTYSNGGIRETIQNLGGPGAVRLIWGDGREFPNTGIMDMTAT